MAEPRPDGKAALVAAAQGIGRAVAETFAREGGRFLQPVQVTVQCATADAVIYYTLDGSEPTQSSPTIVSGASVTVNTTAVLRAKAFGSGMYPSAVHSAAFRVGGQVAIGGVVIP